ncbi:MAG: hypothetical protein EBU84_13610 [Actinobacteria bacterium]|jgi:hypothetical protein|nr:hypothetical protein [Actinomycetota bacterium]
MVDQAVVLDQVQQVVLEIFLEFHHLKEIMVVPEHHLDLHGQEVVAAVLEVQEVLDNQAQHQAEMVVQDYPLHYLVFPHFMLVVVVVAANLDLELLVAQVVVVMVDMVQVVQEVLYLSQIMQ